MCIGRLRTVRSVEKSEIGESIQLADFLSWSVDLTVQRAHLTWKENGDFFTGRGG